MFRECKYYIWQRERELYRICGKRLTGKLSEGYSGIVYTSNFSVSQKLFQHKFKRIYDLKEIRGRMSFNKKKGVMDQLFMSPSKPLTPNVIVLGDRAFAR